MTDTLYVLTGPASGLGRALYDALRAGGAAVLAIGRDLERLTGGGDRVEADFAGEAPEAWLGETEAALRTILARRRPERITLIANAGTIQPIGPAAEIEAAALITSLQVNLVAPMLLAAALVRIATAQHLPLRVVNISTGAAVRPVPGWLAYCAGKAGGRLALDVLAAEHPSVEVMHIDPGVIDTAMQAQIRDRPVGGFRPVAATALKAPDVVAAEILARLKAVGQ